METTLFNAFFVRADLWELFAPHLPQLSQTESGGKSCAQFERLVSWWSTAASVMAVTCCFSHSDGISTVWGPRAHAQRSADHVGDEICFQENIAFRESHTLKLQSLSKVPHPWCLCVLAAVPELMIDHLHQPSMTTDLWQLYDGNLCIAGCKKMLWHKVPMDVAKMQVLPAEKRGQFPFAPKNTNPVSAQRTDAVKSDGGVPVLKPTS